MLYATFFIKKQGISHIRIKTITVQLPGLNAGGKVSILIVRNANRPASSSSDHSTINPIHLKNKS